MKRIKFLWVLNYGDKQIQQDVSKILEVIRFNHVLINKVLSLYQILDDNIMEQNARLVKDLLGKPYKDILHFSIMDDSEFD